MTCSASLVVAFMQNMWVRDPARVRAIIDRHGEEARRKLIYQFLFAGCISGRRLKTAFGNLIETFAVWDWLRKHGYTDDRSMPNAELSDRNL